MEDSDKQSSWDDLARSLGAEPASQPDVAAPPKSTYVVSEEEMEAIRVKAAERAAKQKATPKSWDSLAADFGIEVPPPAELPMKPAAPTPTPPAIRESAPPRRGRERDREEGREREGDRPRRQDRPRRGREGREQGASHTEKRGQEGRSSEERSGETEQRSERPPRGRREGSRRRPRHGERQERDDRGGREERPEFDEVSPHEFAAHADIEESTALARESEPTAAAPESTDEPKQSTAVSLWHRIFGLPEQQTEKIAEISSEAEVEATGIEFVEREEFRQERLREESRGGRRKRWRDAPEEGDQVGSEADTWDGESESARSSDAAEGMEGGEQGESSDEPRRRRRRRGRGRGRGRRSGESGGEERSSGREEGRSEESREPRGRGKSSRSRRQDPRRAPRDDYDDDGLEEIVLDDPEDEAVDVRARDEDGDDVGEGGERVSASGHKSIPSWDEAIGMIVDTNLSQRSDRRRSSAPQSRGNGSSRGRSRGGRRRKKPS